MIGQRVLAFDRTQVDECAVALRSELADSCMAAINKSLQVNVYNACLVFNRDFPETTNSAHTGHVNPDIYFAILLYGSICQALYIFGFAYVHWHHKRSAA